MTKSNLAIDEPEAKSELSARSFREISEVELKVKTEVSERNFLMLITSMNA